MTLPQRRRLAVTTSCTWRMQSPAVSTPAADANGRLNRHAMTRSTRALMRYSVLLPLSVALLAYAAPSPAQQVASSNARSALESRAARAESVAALDSETATVRAERRAEASALRARLRDGDFHVGDRITVNVAGEPTLSNTYTVRSGNVLEIPSVGDVSLHGVLRSELHDVLLREIGRYIKQPEIQVTMLVNVGILGAIGRPGFYGVAPDAPLTDVLMTAGGPTGNTDFARSRIMRGTSEFANASQVRRLLEENATIDQLGLQSGDQIIVGERTNRWQSLPMIVSIVSVLATTAVLFSHR